MLSESRTRGTSASTPVLELTWPAALIGLTFGVMMTYVPYEFGVPAFRPIYPYVRPLGITVLASSLALVGAMLYPRAPRLLDLAGRGGLIAVTTVYWWAVTVLSGSFPGMVFYPLLVTGLALEAHRPIRRMPMFRLFVALVGIVFGLTMAVAPERFPFAIYAYLLPVIRPLGLLFLAAGVALLLPLERWRPGLPRAVLAVLAVPYALLAWALGRGHFWLGMFVYLILMMGCVAEAVAWRPRAPHTVGWKLIRGLAFAGLVPLLALGGLASYFAQRAIEAQVRDDTVRAALGEADFLQRYLEDSRESLRLLRDSPGFREAFARGEPALLEPYLTNLAKSGRSFDAAITVYAEGSVLATSFVDSEALGALPPLSEALPISRPFLGSDRRPQVAVALPVGEGTGPRGMLVGLLSLERLSAASTPAAKRFRVQVLDRRGLHVLRDTAPHAQLLSPTWLPPALAAAVERPGTGAIEGFDAADRHILGAEAPVPNTSWSVVVTQEMNVAYAAITQMSATVVGLLMLGVLLALALSHVVARDVIRRLNALRQATAALAAGESSLRVSEEDDDELGELICGFNEMATRTCAAQAKLREAVRAEGVSRASPATSFARRSLRSGASPA